MVNAKLDFDPIDQFLWARLVYANSFNTGNEDRFEPSGYLTDYWTDESIKVIKANKNRPFFLYLAHWGVHTPLQATREDYEAVGDIKPHRLRVYAAMIRALDRSVGRINAALEEEGLADNTVVLFTSDNGGPGYLGLPDVVHHKKLSAAILPGKLLNKGDDFGIAAVGFHRRDELIDFCIA